MIKVGQCAVIGARKKQIGQRRCQDIEDCTPSILRDPRDIPCVFHVKTYIRKYPRRGSVDFHSPTVTQMPIYLVLVRCTTHPQLSPWPTSTRSQRQYVVHLGGTMTDAPVHRYVQLSPCYSAQRCCCEALGLMSVCPCSLVSQTSTTPRSTMTGRASRVFTFVPYEQTCADDAARAVDAHMGAGATDGR